MSSPAAAASQSKKSTGPVALKRKGKKVVAGPTHTRRSRAQQATFTRPYAVKRIGKETNPRISPPANVMMAAAVDYALSLAVERAAARCGSKKCLTVAHVVTAIKSDSALNALFRGVVGPDMGKVAIFSAQELKELAADPEDDEEEGKASAAATE